MTPPVIAPGESLSLLNASQRARALDSLADGPPVDLLVVGGGVTGCGVALDAASRGMSVALIEAHDLAFGTSRWSSKMVHGGLRYLAKGDIAVAWESAVERERISQHIAPHLVHPFVQVIPFTNSDSLPGRTITRSGMRAGDVLRRATGVSSGYLPAPRLVNPDIAHRLIPGLLPRAVDSAATAWDCRLEDDARFVVALARTAAAYGAQICTHTRALSVDASGAHARDELTGSEFQIRALNVINATGVWAGTVDKNVTVTASRGTHVVVRSQRLGMPTGALTLPVPDHFGRFVFAIPQFNGLTYIGLTDEPVPGDIPDVPVAPSTDVQWILDVINLGLANPLTEEDVVGTYAGLRPLVSDPNSTSDESTADISRRHLVTGQRGELITVTGGKLTTYRQMAQDAVDRISDVPCRTATLPLVGFGAGTPDGLPRRLTRRFGSEASILAGLNDSDPDLLKPLGDGTVRALRAEVLWASMAEGAITYADVAERRLRVSMAPADEEAVRAEIVELMDTFN